MALLSSPLLGVFSLVPILIFLESLAVLTDIGNLITTDRLLLAVVIITLFNLLLWGNNIALLGLQKRAVSIFVNPRFRIFISYVIALGLIGTLIALDIRPRDRPADLGFMELHPFFGVFINNTFILLLINVVVTQREKAELQLEKAELEISNLIAQQDQLKQQIHPHFLFNALGTLKILTTKDPQRAEAYTETLASFLRQSITLSQFDLVPVREELDFFDKYIQYDIDIPEQVLEEGRLPVFSLQILAENAIKHNAFSVSKPLQVKVNFDNGILSVVNNKQPRFTEEASTGLGLRNLKERFSHFTQNLPRISDKEQTFSVTLNVLGQ